MLGYDHCYRLDHTCEALACSSSFRKAGHGHLWRQCWRYNVKVLGKMTLQDDEKLNRASNKASLSRQCSFHLHLLDLISRFEKF